MNAITPSKVFLSLSEAFERAVAADANLSREAFLEQARRHCQSGALHVSGYPCAVELSAMPRLHPYYEFFQLLSAGRRERREISPMEWADLALSFEWGGCAGKGNVDAFGEFTMVASRAGDFEINLWTDLFFRAVEIDELWPCGDTLDGVLLMAANQRGGTLGQKEAEKIARERGVFSTRDVVRERLKVLGIEGKQGSGRKTP